MKRSIRLHFIVQIETENEDDFDEVKLNLKNIAFNSIENGQVTNITNAEISDYSVSVNEVHVFDS